MPELPATNVDRSLVIRTHFDDDGDDQAWSDLKAEIVAPDPVDGCRAYVTFADDGAYAGLSPDDIVAAEVNRGEHSFVFVVDQRTFDDSEHPVLAVDLWEDPGRTFRVVPAEMWAVQNNLSISNMDFSEFADNASPDGVFRGFAEDA